jgi:hypothetical protein
MGFSDTAKNNNNLETILERKSSKNKKNKNQLIEK